MGTCLVLYNAAPLELPSAQNLHCADTLVSHCVVSKADEEMRFVLDMGCGCDLGCNAASCDK